MRHTASSSYLGGCSCEAENPATFRWLFTMCRFFNRLRAAAAYRGFRSNGRAWYWPSPMANASRRWPFGCNVTPRPFGASVGAMNRPVLRGYYRRHPVRAIRCRFPPLQRAQIVQLACLEPGAKGLHITHWSSQDLARQAIAEGRVSAISSATIRRILHEVDLQPHRTHYWKTPRWDGECKHRAEQVRWCYSPAHRLAQQGLWNVCVDEIPNYQVFERCPIRRAIPGSIEQQEFEYTRHGTVNILVFLVVHTGQMEAVTIERKDAAHYIQELDRFRQRHRPLRGVFLIQDGDPSHTVGDTQNYLANANRWWRPRFTPVHASWLNQAEILIHSFSHHYLKRQSWHSRDEFIEQVMTAWPEYNDRYAKPIEWTWTNHKMRRWFEKHT